MNASLLPGQIAHWPLARLKTLALPSSITITITQPP